MDEPVDATAAPKNMRESIHGGRRFCIVPGCSTDTVSVDRELTVETAAPEVVAVRCGTKGYTMEGYAPFDLVRHLQGSVRDYTPFVN